MFHVVSLNHVFAEDKQSFQEQMKDTINNYIERQHASVTVAYQNLITGERVEVNGNQASSAASTIKLPFALYLIDQVNKGNVKLDQKLTYQSYHYYAGSGIIQNDPVGSEYTVEQLLKKMLIHSDNIAFIMLKELVGREQFINYIEEIGGEYAYPNGHNLTSTDDLILYLDELFHLANQDELAQKVVGWLKETDYNDGLPKEISQPIAHKVGMIPMNNISNDAGIIFDDQPYALAIMTDGFPYEYSKHVIADLAKLISEEHRQHVEAYYKIPTDTLMAVKDSLQWFQPFRSQLSKPFIFVMDSFQTWLRENDLNRNLVVQSERIEVKGIYQK